MPLVRRCVLLRALAPLALLRRLPAAVGELAVVPVEAIACVQKDRRVAGEAAERRLLLRLASELACDARPKVMVDRFCAVALIRALRIDRDALQVKAGRG